MVQELKELGYVPQLKRNLISVGSLETLGREVSIKDGVLKMTKGSTVVLEGVRWNNLYYLKGSTVTGQVVASVFHIFCKGKNLQKSVEELNYKYSKKITSRSPRRF